jgi:hypothetical protein
VQILWITLGSIAGLLFAAAVGRFLSGLRPSAELRGLPATPIEKLAWLGLGASLSVGAGLGLVVLVGGTAALEDSPYRWVFWLLLWAAIGTWMIAWHRTNRRRGGAVVDERDRAILARSLSVESMVVLLSLVTWTVTLTEVYSQEGAVPVAYLQLLFWSTFLIAIFGRSLGIILGYRQEAVPDA